jgi:anti-sigma regulatory factor (Ser/Thr protein kinase)
LTASGLAQPIALFLRPAPARRQVEALLRREGWRGEADGVALALHEALVNAARHAGGVRRAEAALDGSSLVISVWDRGPGFDPSPYVNHSPDPMAEQGRGLWLISQLTSSWEVRRDDEGTAVVMRFDRL